MRALAASPLAAAALAAGLLAAACGDDSSGSGGAGSGGGSTASHSTSSAPAGSTTTAGAGAGASSSSTSATDATASSGNGGAGGAPALCASCGEPTDAGVVANAEITELSGLAASRLHDDVLYAHNDSGDVPRFFALSTTGEDRGTFSVPSATAVDWEEIAAGPCEDGAEGCLYLADFGDNDEVRDDLVLYRVHEPESVGEGTLADVEAEAFPFSYPDGPHNAEAFVVHPTTGVVTIFTKGATSRIYELAAPLAPDMTATFVGEVTLDSFIPLVTAADVDPAGEVVALRTYADVFLYPVADGSSAGQAVLAGASCVAPRAAESQGEAIAFLMNGTSYVTASEGGGSTLHRIDCP